MEIIPKHLWVRKMICIQDKWTQAKMELLSWALMWTNNSESEKSVQKHREDNPGSHNTNSAGRAWNEMSLQQHCKLVSTFQRVSLATCHQCAEKYQSSVASCSDRKLTCYLVSLWHRSLCEHLLISITICTSVFHKLIILKQKEHALQTTSF